MANYQAAPQAGEPPLEWPWYGIGFGAAVKRFFKKYATFSGRASRGEYWYAYLFNALVGLVLSIILGIVVSAAAAAAARAQESGGTPSLGAGFYLGYALVTLWGLAILIPSLAAGVRRLHDTGRPGVYILMGLIPFVGGIILIVLLAGPTTPAAEQFGPPYSQAQMPGYGNQGGYQQSYPPQV